MFASHRSVFAHALGSFIYAGVKSYRLVKAASGKNTPAYLRPGMRIHNLKEYRKEWTEVTVQRCPLYEWWERIAGSKVGKRCDFSFFLFYSSFDSVVSCRLSVFMALWLIMVSRCV